MSDVSVRTARAKSFAKITPTSKVAESPAPQPEIAQQRTEGNQASAGERGPQPRRMLDGETVEQIAKDIETIADKFRSQTLWESEEREILELIRHWVARDRAMGAGTPHVDEFLYRARQRVYKRSTARSGFIEQWANLYDDFFRELEDDRLTAFESLVQKSREYRGPPSEKDMPENFWRTMGKKEAVGVWGILKGMGTSLAGLSDSGAWAVTRAMRAAGVDVADPVSAAAWLAEQYDISGDAMFGKEEWSEGEELFLGMSAAEFSTHGGEMVWALAMMGRGGGAGWAAAVEKALGVSGNLMVIEGSAKNIFAMLERMQKTNPSGEVDVALLLQDPEFDREMIRLVSAIFGAVAGKSVGAQRINVLLDVAQLAPTLGQIIQIHTSAAPMSDKLRLTGPVLMELLKEIIAVAGSAKNARAARKDAEAKKGGGEKKQEQKQQKDDKKLQSKSPAKDDDTEQLPAKKDKKSIQSAPAKVKQIAGEGSSSSTVANKKAATKKKTAPKKSAAGKKSTSKKKASSATKLAASKAKSAPKKPAAKQSGPKKASPKKAAPKKPPAPKAEGPMTQQEAARAYQEDLKSKPTRDGLASGWDYEKHPKGTGKRWKVGDPINAPTRHGYPKWKTLRQRLWKTLAHNELKGREDKKFKRVATQDLHPTRSVGKKKLEQMLKTGKGPKGFEIEHAGIPQRMVGLMRAAGLSKDQARFIGRLGDPENLEPMHRTQHAAWDKAAADPKYGRNPPINKPVDSAEQKKYQDKYGGKLNQGPLDDRDEFPLQSLDRDQSRALLDKVNALPPIPERGPQPYTQQDARAQSMADARAELRRHLQNNLDRWSGKMPQSQ